MNNLQVLEKSVVGFSQTTELVNNFGFPERRQQVHPKINSLAQEQMEVNVRAQKMGFKPLAVVPVKLLHAAFKKFGLYWFEEIDKQGRVRVNINPEISSILRFVRNNDITGSIIELLAGVYASLVVVAGIVFFFLLLDSFNNPLNSKALLIQSFSGKFVLYNLVPMICLSFIMSSLDESESKLKQKILFQKSFFFPKKHLFKLLFNGKRDNYLRIHFNVPLNIFTRTLNLMRQHNLQPCVAAVPEAISINRKELRQLIKQEQRRIKEEEQRRRALEKDPILYYIDGNYAVIVGQYGDFASEKKLVKWVKKEGLSILLN